MPLLARESVHHDHYLAQGFVTGWLTGIVWYGFNCYWIYQTMFIYGGLPSSVSVGILVLYSLILGLYFGLFGWMVAVVRRHLRPSRCLARCAVPLGLG